MSNLPQKKFETKENLKFERKIITTRLVSCLILLLVRVKKSQDRGKGTVPNASAIWAVKCGPILATSSASMRASLSSPVSFGEATKKFAVRLGRRPHRRLKWEGKVKVSAFGFISGEEEDCT